MLAIRCVNWVNTLFLIMFVCHHHCRGSLILIDAAVIPVNARRANWTNLWYAAIMSNVRENIFGLVCLCATIYVLFYWQGELYEVITLKASPVLLLSNNHNNNTGNNNNNNNNVQICRAPQKPTKAYRGDVCLQSYTTVQCSKCTTGLYEHVISCVACDVNASLNFTNFILLRRKRYHHHHHQRYGRVKCVILGFSRYALCWEMKVKSWRTGDDRRSL